MVELAKATNDEILMELYDRWMNRHHTTIRVAAIDGEYRWVAVLFRNHITDQRKELYDTLKAGVDPGQTHTARS